MLTRLPGRIALARSKSPSATRTKELEDAVSDFESSLSNERRAQLQLLKSSDDSHESNAAQTLLTHGKKEKDSRRRCRALLMMQGFLESVQEFSAIIDSITGVNPIAATVWGAVKLFITYAIKFTHFL
jgi:hypothetical protein